MSRPFIVNQLKKRMEKGISGRRWTNIFMILWLCKFGFQDGFNLTCLFWSSVDLNPIRNMSPAPTPKEIIGGSK